MILLTAIGSHAMHLLAIFNILGNLSARNSRMLDQNLERAVKRKDDGNINRASEGLLFG